MKDKIKVLLRPPPPQNVFFNSLLRASNTFRRANANFLYVVCSK